LRGASHENCISGMHLEVASPAHIRGRISRPWIRMVVSGKRIFFYW
jgi:hypothetical protein